MGLSNSPGSSSRALGFRPKVRDYLICTKHKKFLAGPPPKINYPRAWAGLNPISSCDANSNSLHCGTDAYFGWPKLLKNQKQILINSA